MSNKNQQKNLHEVAPQKEEVQVIMVKADTFGKVVDFLQAAPYKVVAGLLIELQDAIVKPEQKED